MGGTVIEQQHISSSRVRTRRHRRLLTFGVVIALVLISAACVDVNNNTLARPEEPVVFTGSQLAGLIGVAPGRIVAFKHTRPNGTPTWTQVPVQVDQRKVVDFGQYPASNATAGVDGTVYGTTPIGVTALQYADPNTFVGADSDPNFDADDELVFMSSDGGGTVLANEKTEPAGVVSGSGVQVQLSDPIASPQRAAVYLFVSDGTLDPSAGLDYVDYNFNLSSGNYKTTYKRADGPNAETSQVTTANYQLGFDDRWIETRWQISAGGATGADILDGVKARFGLTTCVRSNLTFSDGEGAFIANIDGPVRAIRSYVGANSGPLTERTHVMYRDREETYTNLRVHQIPGIMDYVDYSTSAIGMTYQNSANETPVTIDGAADAVSTAVPSWELVTGPQGSAMVAGQVTTSIIPIGGTLDDIVDGFYRDELNSPVDQCWGDPHFLGASGLSFVTSIPNTDPTLGTAAVFNAKRIVRFAAPGATAATASAWSDDVNSPLTRAVTAYTL
jgi:hypothetical protein